MLARAHGGRLPVRGMPTDLRALLEDIAGRHRPRATGAGVAIDVDASSGAVCVDQVRLRQALDDLLDNAVRYTPRGGVITVTGSVEGGTIALSVLDSGPGFSADVLSRAFEPFVGDPGAGGAGRDGAGLGLSIVRVIADAHGGSVAAENTPGGGARVTMTIADLA